MRMLERPWSLDSSGLIAPKMCQTKLSASSGNVATLVAV